MVNVTRAYNNHVISEVVGLVEVKNHVSVDLVNVIDVSKDRLTHHMLSVDVIVDVFHQSLHEVVVCRQQFLPYCIFFHLQVVLIIGRVA